MLMEKVKFSNLLRLLEMLIISVRNPRIGLASLYPEPADKISWLKNQLYNFNYESSMPITWSWPEMPHIKTRELEPTILHNVKK